MDFTGRFNTIGRDLSTGEYILDLRVKEDARSTFQKLKDCEVLDIIIRKHRKRRSLDANAYYWVLIRKLAKAIGQSNAWTHNFMLRIHGPHEIIDGKEVNIYLPDTDEAENKVNEAERYHLKPTSDVKLGDDGVMYRNYKMLRGSSSYDTKEMSVLIDDVVGECKELGIETLPMHEIDRMKQEWGVDIAQKD